MAQVETQTVQNLSNLPTELLTALGRVAAYSGHIEHIFTLTLKRTDEDMSWEDAHQQARELWSNHKIRKEAKRRYSEWADQTMTGAAIRDAKNEFADLVSRTEELFKNRAHVVHCAWSTTDDGQLNATRQGRLLLDPQRNRVGIRHVNELADRLFEVACRLNAATRPDLVTIVPAGNS